MSRIKRYYEPGAIYFITSITKHRKEILVGDVARFLILCIGYHKFMLNFKLYGYVIMPDHFHILIQVPINVIISKIIKLIKGNFARKYNEIVKKSGSVWQEGYWDTILRKESEILEKLNYIHYNPVKKGLVKSPEEYEFSSIHNYLKETRKNVQIVIDPFTSTGLKSRLLYV